MTLTPAYGRDYNSKQAVIDSFVSGKDFVMNDISSKYHGMYCSIRDFPVGQTLAFRYNQLRKITTYKIKASDK